LKKIELTAFVLMIFLLWAGSCRDAPRDNPFDPESETLLVSILSPGDSSEFPRGDSITFRAEARTGFDNAPVVGGHFVWRSNIAGMLSESSGFSTDSLPVGTHGITVSVTDEQNRSGSAFIKVIVLPTPDFGVIIKNPPADTIILVEYSMTPFVKEYVPSGSTVIGRLWYFGEGSGIPNSTQKDPGSIVWNQAGTFKLVYQIVDNLGRSAADTVLVTVLSESLPPVAAIISPHSDTTLYKGDSLYLEALDIETTVRIVRRGWLYPEGSGLESRVDSFARPGWRTFSQVGTFELVYRVTDLLGVSAADSVVVTVLAGPSPPVAEILSPSRDTTIYRGTEVSFTATDSDPDGEVVERLWTWDAGSGIEPAYSDSTRETGPKIFGAVGSFIVRYMVTDNSGAQGVDSVIVTVAENVLPTATILNPSTDTTLAAWVPIAFRASDYDPEGAVVSRGWSFGAGSGVQAKDDTTSVTGPKTFTTAGKFTITYTVTDEAGGVGADSIKLTVLANNPPNVEIISPIGNQSIAAGDSVFFMALDSDPGGSIAKRKWDYGAGSGIDATADTVSVIGNRAFNIQGTFTVIYMVTDNMGVSRSDSLTVKVGSGL